MAKDEKKQKREKFTTARGLFVYPRINKADTKYKADGEYSLKLHLPVAEVTALMATLDEDADKALAAAIEANDGKNFVMIKGKKKPIERNAPYFEVLEDDGETKTGMVEFKFGANATFKDSKDGDKIKPRTPPGIFDAKGKPTKVQVWSGSEGKVSYTKGPYFIKATGAAGVKLYLEAVQILKLVSGSGQDASQFGFGAEEGYEAEDDLPKQDGDESSGDSKPAAGAGSDF